jgi:Tfp pilus assembly protein PilF
MIEKVVIPTAIRSHPLWEKARIALRDGRFEAIDEIRREVKRDKLPGEVASALEIELLFAAGDKAQANRLLAEVRRARALGPHEKLVAAHLALEEHRIEEAAELLFAAKKAGLRDPRIAAGLGQVEAARSKPKDALFHLEEALRRDPKQWHARFLLGCVLLELGDKSKACACFERVTKDRREFEPGWRAYAHALEESGRRERALEVLSALAKRSSSPELLLQYAELCTVSGHVDAAKSALAKLQWQDRIPAGAHLLRGRIAETERDAASALAHYRKAIAADPRSSRIKNALGRLLMLDTPVKNLCEAAEVLESAVRAEHPPPVAPLLNLAIVRAQEGKADLAKKLAERVLAMKPSDPSFVEQAERLIAEKPRAT